MYRFCVHHCWCAWQVRIQGWSWQPGSVCFPWGLALSADGKKLLCCDYDNHRVRQIDLQDGSFTVSTLIGNGERKDSDGPVSINRACIGGPHWR